MNQTDVHVHILRGNSNVHLFVVSPQDLNMPVKMANVIFSILPTECKFVYKNLPKMPNEWKGAFTFYLSVASSAPFSN